MSGGHGIISIMLHFVISVQSRERERSTGAQVIARDRYMTFTSLRPETNEQAERML